MNILSIIPGLINLGSELIEDPDKKAEFAYKAMELESKLKEKMLDTKTHPKVDAVVKLAYAGNDIVKGLFRPIGAVLMFCFAAYCQLKSIELSEGIQMLLYGSAPAWGVSRHMEKGKKKAPKKGQDEDLWDEED